MTIPRTILRFGVLAFGVMLGCSKKASFLIRGTELKSDSPPGMGTSYSYESTVIQTSGPTSAKYLVMIRAVRLSGGRSELWKDGDTTYTWSPVVRGVAHMTIYGGYRTRDESWEPARITLEPIGYLRLEEVR